MPYPPPVPDGRRRGRPRRDVAGGVPLPRGRRPQPAEQGRHPQGRPLQAPATHLDPQGVSLADDEDLSQQITRTLTVVTSPGKQLPDLATDTGRPTDNDQIWEFTLKSDPKWQDGSRVTCPDVRYGIERRFAPVISAAAGLPYPITYMKDNAKPYKGPLRGRSQGSRVDPLRRQQHDPVPPPAGRW